jgi:hypothetical protein
MLQKTLSKFLFGFIFFSLVLAMSAQTKQNATKRNVKKTAQVKPITSEQAPLNLPVKKNERPMVENQESSTENDTKTNNQNSNPNSRPVSANEVKPTYHYEFSQPNFVISQISIEHDENGKGKITFLKKDFSEPISDPIQLSPATLERIKTAYQTLNFLDSTENYQYEKDYSHLGNMKFTQLKDGRERTAKFNYTVNKDAKILADEYRKIGQQYVWVFDLNVARVNQPLEAPRLFDALDSLVKRDEISDAPQMIPFLRELSNDERLPLIARNHATRLIKMIEKKKEERK